MSSAVVTLIRTLTQSAVMRRMIMTKNVKRRRKRKMMARKTRMTKKRRKRRKMMRKRYTSLWCSTIKVLFPTLSF